MFPKLQLVVLAHAIGAAAQSISSCGAASDHLKDVKITVSPEPIKAGAPFTISTTGTLDAAVGGGTVSADLDIKALGVIDKHVKSSVPFSIKPGVVAGPQTLTIGPMTLPKLPGSVLLKGTIKVQNEAQEQVTCLNFDLNVPAMEEELASEKGAEEAAPVSDCSQPSDHLKNLKFSTVSGKTTATGTLDELVSKFTVAGDLLLKIGFLSHKLDLSMPIEYSPGVPQGDLQITFGPEQEQEVALPNVDVKISGTVKINDGNAQEITCLRVDKEREDTIDAFAYFNMTLPAQASQVVSVDQCTKPGDCGHAYQVCCAGFAAKGHPCGCHLKDGSGAAGTACGDCGIAYEACCIGFKAKGFPCGCDVEPVPMLFSV